MTQSYHESDLPRARTSLKLPERSDGALFNRFYNVTVSAVKRREYSGSPSAGSFQRRLCVRQQRRQHIHPRLQALAQPAQEPRHAQDQQELARYLHQRVGPDRPRQARVRLRDEVGIGVGAARLAGLHERAPDHEVGRRVLRPVGAEAQVAERLHHFGRVGRYHRVHELRVAQAELVVQLAAEAEVQHDELRARPHEEVAGVRVGVEHAVQEQLLAVGVGDQLRYGLEVYAGVLEGADVGDLDPLEELHNQHAAGRVLPVDPGHDDIRPGGEVGGDELRVVALVDEVQLLRHVPADLLDDGPKVQVALQRRQDAQEESNAVQVRLYHVPDARILDLHGHRAAVFERGPVDLGERRRGDRLGFEVGEDVGQGTAELAGDLPLDDGEGAGRHLVLETRKGVDVLVGDEVGA